MINSLSAGELREFRGQLQQRERQLLDELQSERERAGIETFQQTASEAPDPGDAAVADNATDQLNADRQRDFEELQAVQAALTRIEDGSYGICFTCGELIDRERLRAYPTAKYDIKHQEELDRRAGAPSTPTL